MPDANLTRDEAAARAALLTVDSYAIELDLTSSERTFTSRTTVRFGCARPGADTFIDLIAPTVHEVILNGRRLDVAAVVSEARIALPGLAADNELIVVADAAYMNTGEGLHRFVDPVDKEVYLYSQFEVADARRVFACFDQPDLKDGHLHVDRARAVPLAGALGLAQPEARAAAVRLARRHGRVAVRAHAATVDLRHRDRRRPVPPAVLDHPAA